MRAAHRGHPSCNKSNNYGKRACHAFRLAPLTPFVAQFACFDMSLNLQRCPTRTHTHAHTGRHRHAVIHKQQSNRNCPRYQRRLALTFLTGRSDHCWAAPFSYQAYACVCVYVVERGRGRRESRQRVCAGNFVLCARQIAPYYVRACVCVCEHPCMCVCVYTGVCVLVLVCVLCAFRLFGAPLSTLMQAKPYLWLYHTLTLALTHTHTRP